MLLPAAVHSFAFPLRCLPSATLQNWPLGRIKPLEQQEGGIKGAVGTSAGSLVVPSCWLDLEHALKCQGGNNPNTTEPVPFVQLLGLAVPLNGRVMLPELVLAELFET